jgi:hypothetical protein
MPLEDLRPYFRGARFALRAMHLRHPEDKELAADIERYTAMLDHYAEAAMETFKLRRERGGGVGETTK